jgi:hypothetical protein
MIALAAMTRADAGAFLSFITVASVLIASSL